ncbi:hypothetical protein ACLUTX_03075 [Enterobacterales bacterium AE_CKDN230030158-1A_HGKHYDSX7]
MVTETNDLASFTAPDDHGNESRVAHADSEQGVFPPFQPTETSSVRRSENGSELPSQTSQALPTNSIASAITAADATPLRNASDPAGKDVTGKPAEGSSPVLATEYHYHSGSNEPGTHPVLPVELSPHSALHGIAPQTDAFFGAIASPIRYAFATQEEFAGHHGTYIQTTPDEPSEASGLVRTPPQGEPLANDQKQALSKLSLDDLLGSSAPDLFSSPPKEEPASAMYGSSHAYHQHSDIDIEMLLHLLNIHPV